MATWITMYDWTDSLPLQTICLCMNYFLLVPEKFQIKGLQQLWTSLRKDQTFSFRWGSHISCWLRHMVDFVLFNYNMELPGLYALISTVLCCNNLGWNLSIKILDIFELLTFILCLNGQIWFWYESFPVAYLSGGVFKRFYDRVVNIEVVPI